MPKDDITDAGSSPPWHSPVISPVAAALEDELAKPLIPGLYLVSTPIGNLADISLRALATLARVELICCEDTRHSRTLFSHFGISGKIHAYHEHNARRERPRILAALEAGQTVALVSDAGTPLISDPGHKLAREVLEAGFPVIAIPGASAILAALTSSGLPADRFFFEGFLPPRREARRKRLETLSDMPATIVFFEAPSRIQAMLADARDILGSREAAIAKELTKLHEAVWRGSFEELAARAGKDFVLKGEFVVLAGPPAPTDISDDDIREKLKGALGKSSFRDGVQDVSDMLDVPRKRVYKIALGIKDAK
ncbi:MAG: 16S rRNA (cytidine(1402)-2'-O)-methyltransferase [Proteobacteria bacterium]|nr:16S rRNA (cytidine(1402)-2'-O)-methyltransferase [Pseudomonadota bacterium]